MQGQRASTQFVKRIQHMQKSLCRHRHWRPQPFENAAHRGTCAHTHEHTHRHKQFVVQVLRHKVPVASRLQYFGIAWQAVCPLCRATEDHDHVLKKCFYSRDLLASIRCP
uniref:Reverse transcriptase zinc-binding domain-containing protein n=1 Tax=Eutreptiella gymnastica TaxID=73025 RepID=A0A7S4CN70_9EUGL